MNLPPVGDPAGDVRGDVGGQLLEERARGAAASGAGGDLRREVADAERLQHLLAHAHLRGAVAARLGGEARADGVADAFVEQDRERRRGRDDTGGGHPGLGESEMERVVARGPDHPVHGHEISYVAHLGREDDGVVRLAEALGQLGRAERALAHRFEHDLAVGARLGAAGVLVHQPRQERAVQRAPVDADPHRLPVSDRHLDHAAEVLVVFLADPDVAGVDAVLVEIASAGRELGEQRVAVVVKVAHDRRRHARAAHLLHHRGNGGRGFARVHGDPHDFRAGVRELDDLAGRGGGVRRVRVGHRLHDDRVPAPDRDVADAAHHALPASRVPRLLDSNQCHGCTIGSPAKQRQTAGEMPQRLPVNAIQTSRTGACAADNSFVQGPAWGRPLSRRKNARS